MFKNNNNQYTLHYYLIFFLLNINFLSIFSMQDLKNTKNNQNIVLDTLIIDEDLVEISIKKTSTTSITANSESMRTKESPKKLIVDDMTPEKDSQPEDPEPVISITDTQEKDTTRSCCCAFLSCIKRK